MSPKIDNVGFAGSGHVQKSKNLETMEFRACKIMKSGFDCTDLKQIKSRKLLKLLFKPISPINCPKMTIIIPINVPTIFLYFSHDLAYSS